MDSIQEANYIKLDGRVFSITPIANSDMDIEAELKQFYNEKYKRHIELFNGGVVQGLTEDWEGQIERLQHHNRRSTVTVPDSMMGKYMVCNNGRDLEEVRGIIYSPNIFKMVRGDLANHLNINVEVEHDEDGHTIARHYEGTVRVAGDAEVDLNEFSDDDVLLVEVRRKIFHCAMYSFNAQSDRLNCLNLTTFHSQSTAICTGSHRASDFWRNPAFPELMNQVNCFSLGSQTVSYRDGTGGTHGISSYVKRSTIIGIQPERAGTWRT
jgi:hypothetical protein